jgi:hypothetical protein
VKPGTDAKMEVEKDMGWLAYIGLGVLSVAVAGGAVLLVGMRTKNGVVQRAVMGFTKNVVNPRTVHSAGTSGASAALLRNVGRSSGHTYETPVGAVAFDGGFLVSMPYGTRPNWLRNVLAAGGATLVHEGVAHLVDRPEIVALAPLAHAFGPSDQMLHRVFGVNQVLRLRLVEAAVTVPTTIASAA